MQTKDAPIKIDLDVTGIDELRFMVDEAGESNSYDHANWAGIAGTAGLSLSKLQKNNRCTDCN